MVENINEITMRSQESVFFELITNHTFDLILLITEDGDIIFQNEATKRLLDFEPDQVIGQNGFDYIHPEDRSRVRPKFQKLIHVPDQEVTIECRVRCHDGGWRWLEAKGQNLLDNEFLRGILVNARDITEKKQQEFEILQLNKRLELSFNAGIMAWWELELPSGNVKYHENKVKMLGYQKERFTHYSHFMELVHPDDNECVINSIKEHISGETPYYKCEYRIKDAEGNYLWFHDIGKVTHREGEHVLINGIATDLSDQKKAESELRKRADTYHSRNLTQNKLFSIISHDLKNPMSAIIGFSDLALVSLNNNRTERVKRYCQIIKDSANHNLTLLNNLLDWSSLHAGVIDFHPRQFHLQDAIKPLLNFTTANAFIKEISFNLEIPARLQVYADRNMLDTVMRNLISNAIKFTDQHGTVSLSAKESGSQVHIEIEDNGVGIVPEKIENIFDIEKRSVTQGTHNEPGTGIGLFICREFVEKHGGRIWVESKVGEGTKFTFTLPKQ